MFWLNRVHSLTFPTPVSVGIADRTRPLTRPPLPLRYRALSPAQPLTSTTSIGRWRVLLLVLAHWLVVRPLRGAPCSAMALVPHRRKEGRSHCEALIPASQTVGGCQLAEVQERLHQARLNITDYLHYCDGTSCRPQHVTGYPLKKIWDEARDLRWTLASATEPPDAETYSHDDPPSDYLGNRFTREEREQWRR